MARVEDSSFPCIWASRAGQLGLVAALALVAPCMDASTAPTGSKLGFFGPSAPLNLLCDRGGLEDAEIYLRGAGAVLAASPWRRSAPAPTGLPLIYL